MTGIVERGTGPLGALPELEEGWKPLQPARSTAPAKTARSIGHAVAGLGETCGEGRRGSG